MNSKHNVRPKINYPHMKGSPSNFGIYMTPEMQEKTIRSTKHK